ncbi:chaplin family protein [Streptomyces sp. NPDC008137]|uniref:chaplin n=1 Tax=Streptomyces sp. NPDC008137 TaxID=3364813 RepID=UPI0036EF1112
MRQTLSKGAFAAAAATGILSLYGSPALADADASGVAKDSPGVASGNSVQVPVHVPVNLCGNTVNGLAALNKAIGNSCKNTSHKPKHHDGGAGADASAVTKGSPGVLSGNNVQAPVDLPLNACGNSVDGGAALNSTYGNDCENESSGGGYGHDHGHDTPSTDEEKTPPAKEVPTPDEDEPTGSTPDTEDSSVTEEAEVEEGPLPQLAETGSEALAAASAASAALIVGGVMMYRRGRTSSSR